MFFFQNWSYRYVLSQENICGYILEHWVILFSPYHLHAYKMNKDGYYKANLLDSLD